MTADDILNNWRRSLASYQQAVFAFKRAQQVMQRRQMSPHAGPSTGAVIPREPPRLLADSEIDHVEMLSVGRLTRREREIARLISRGMTNSQIAETLIIEKGTVANHVAHILNKLSLTNRTQVATLVLRWPVVSQVSPAPVQDGTWFQQSA
jgi:DNA-binding NarL/FixJ family response regulator